MLRFAAFFIVLNTLAIATQAQDVPIIPNDAKIEGEREEAGIIHGSVTTEEVKEDEAELPVETQELTIPHPDKNTSEEKSTQAKRPWGSAGSASAHAGAAVSSNSVHSDHEVVHEEQKSHNGSVQSARGSPMDDNATKVSPPNPPNHIPFVASKPPNHRSPPDGFSISARVYLDPKDRHAHFDDSLQPITLPFWDCGAMGATTSALPLKNAFFRQVLASTTTSWSSVDGKHPVLAVALSPMVIELNSGEVQRFEAGEIILLDDVLLVGHRMRSGGGGDLKLLFLTLPQQHYYPGKSNVSLKVGKKSKDPCPNTGSPLQINQKEMPRRDDGLSSRNNQWNGRKTRLVLFATFGVSISSFVADFLGKTAPLWLAVAVGGTCFVGGGTLAITVAAEKLFTLFELWHERRRLGLSNTPGGVTDHEPSDKDVARQQ